MNNNLNRVISLLIFAFFALTLPAKTYVVGVGISRYQNGWQNDWKFGAEDVQTTCRTFDNDRYADVFVLVNENATKDHILRVLRNKFSKAKASDEIIFVYSGHGGDGLVTCYDSGNCLYVDEIQKIMRQSKASRKLILMGSCHSGSFKKQGKSTPETVTRNHNSNVVLVLSARPEEEAIGWLREPISVFFKHLNNGLNGGADANSDEK